MAIDEKILKLTEDTIRALGPIGCEEIWDLVCSEYRRVGMEYDLRSVFAAPEALYAQGKLSRRKPRMQYPDGPPAYIYSIKRKPVPESVQPRLFILPATQTPPRR